jgi:hypothetical protein
LPELHVETRASGEAPTFRGPTEDLVYFLSFAVAERYGATHDLSGLARILRSRAPQDRLRPLLTFAEQSDEDQEDRADMERIWQPAAPVAESAGWVASEIRSSQRLQELSNEFPQLLPRLEELAQIASWSAERDADIRLLFQL